MKNIDFSRWETWGHGLFAAVITSAATTGAALLNSWITNKGIDWHQLGISLGTSSLLAAFLYLKSSPLPSLDVTTVTTSGANEVTITPAATAPAPQALKPSVDAAGNITIPPK